MSSKEPTYNFTNKPVMECEYALRNGTESCRRWKGGAGNMAEWAPEGEQKDRVCEPEKGLRNQIQHM